MKVIIVGYGAIGKLLTKRINESSDYELSGVVDPLLQYEYAIPGFESINYKPDVIIDFSHPDNIEDMLKYALENKVPLVIGTTGISDRIRNKIHQAAKKIPIVFTGNTSIGINLILNILKNITGDLYNDFDIEVIEKHHNKKLDSPSGTAKMLINTIDNNLNKDYDLAYGRHGMKKREHNEIGVHAIRGGTIVGEHTVILAGNDEVIEIKHTALSKQVFISGALKAAKYIVTKENGLHSMEDVLYKKEMEVVIK